MASEPIKPVEPRKAAACIIYRESPSPEVLLARRNENLRFMAGHHVFPGGRIEDDESTAHVTGAANDLDARAVHAVAREVFEETGLLCARGTLPKLEDAREARHALLENRTTFDDVLDRFALTISADDFEPAGVWVTPRFSPIRFDTRYYLHRVSSKQEEHLIDGEIVGLDWVSPAEARRLWHTGGMKISTPVAFALQQLAGKPYPEVMPYLSRGTERAPGEHSRFEIRRGITIIPLVTRTLAPATHTNCVVVGERDLYVIDPGASDDAEQNHLHNQLDNMIALGGEVRAVVLTHSHRDHVDGVEAVQARYECPVWAHAAVRGQVKFGIDRELNEGETIESSGEPGWRLRVFHTPGHDPGHLCFLDEYTGVMLGGDMVANPGTIVVSQSFGGDMGQFMEQLERLSRVKAKVLVPSHGAVLGKPDEAFLGHLKHRQWREDKIRGVLERGVTQFGEILAAAYDDAPKEAMDLARHALAAHLAKLGVVVDEKQGRIAG